jgi:hypothetical protein
MSLVLKYVTQAMNTTLSTVLALTPDGQTVGASMAIMNGQHEMSGTARKLAPGEVVAFTGLGDEIVRASVDVAPCGSRRAVQKLSRSVADP